MEYFQHSFHRYFLLKLQVMKASIRKSVPPNIEHEWNDFTKMSLFLHRLTSAERWTCEPRTLQSSAVGIQLPAMLYLPRERCSHDSQVGALKLFAYPPPLSIFLLKPDQMNTKTTSAGWSCTAVWYQHHCFWNRLPKISYSSTASWLLSPTGWLQTHSNKWKTSHKQRELAQFFGQLLHLKATPAIPVQGENGLCCNAREVSGFWRERISVQQCSQTMLDML